MRESKLVKLETPIHGKKLVELTAHALERMEQRSVSQQDLLDALEKGKGVPGRQPKGRKRIRWYKNSKNCIHVIFETKDDRIGVISVIAKLSE